VDNIRRSEYNVLRLWGGKWYGAGSSLKDHYLKSYCKKLDQTNIKSRVDAVLVLLQMLRRLNLCR
jgi:hypothetical protein